jgi:ADP-ribose pyrophosphatase YjhB (NUDIX family)
VSCAGAIVFDATGRLLVIRRGRPPAQGSWSIPGGRCEPGESAAETCVREVAEETGLVVEVQRWAGRVERAAPHGAMYDIDDFVCGVRGGTLAAADDAADARWVTGAEFGALALAPLLYETLRDWDCLPRC